MKITVDAQGLQDPCKGRFFRYTEAGFTGKNQRVVLTRELRPLKSISCPGCPECAGLNAELEARVNEINFLQFCPTLKSGDTVKLVQIPVERDYSTGELKKWYYEVSRADTT
jgi:hypothetical protein